MLKQYIRIFNNAILGGMAIALGGAVYLNVGNKYVGAGLFSVALLVICLMEFALYTGRIGDFIIAPKKWRFTALLAVMLLGNLIAAIAFGLMFSAAVPSTYTAAKDAVNTKYTQALWQTFLRAIGCNILIYCAVACHRRGRSWMIPVCVMAFILSGFEHSIADAFYFAAAREFSLRAAVYILVVIAGNTVGGLFIPAVYWLQSKLNED